MCASGHGAPASHIPAASAGLAVSRMSDESEAQAHALVERLFALLHECRVLVPQLEAARAPESPSAEAEQLLYYALAGAIEASLVRTAETCSRC
jgi:hypothetical protein